MVQFLLAKMPSFGIGINYMTKMNMWFLPSAGFIVQKHKTKIIYPNLMIKPPGNCSTTVETILAKLQMNGTATILIWFKPQWFSIANSIDPLSSMSAKDLTCTPKSGNTWKIATIPAENLPKNQSSATARRLRFGQLIKFSTNTIELFMKAVYTKRNKERIF